LTSREEEEDCRSSETTEWELEKRVNIDLEHANNTLTLIQKHHLHETL